MSLITVAGDPEKVCGFIATLISGGNYVGMVKKTKNNATYIVDYVSGAPETFLLMENGSLLLLEEGSKIVLE